MRPPFFIAAKLHPWYRPVIVVAAFVIAVTMWVTGTQDGPATGLAPWAWVPLVLCVFVVLRWHNGAERAWKAENPQG